MKNKAMKQTATMLEKRYGAARTREILSSAEEIFRTLCAENARDSKAVKFHTEQQIYPCISLYEGMQRAGIQKEEAVAFLDRAFSQMAEPKAASMRAMLKLPGLYKLMPKIFKFVTLRQFGEKAGFRATFYDMGKDRCKFDMTKCLYCDTCRKYSCPELTPCFCHTDDVTDGNMHPNILWNRTKIMGDGADCCDFDIIVMDHPVNK